MSNLSIEKIILHNLIKNEQFSRQCLPYLQEEYFQDKIESSVFKIISDYLKKTNRLPQKSILLIEIEEQKINDKDIETAKELINDIFSIETVNDYKWLIDQSEIFCREKAMYIAIMNAIKIYDGSNKELSPHAIPDIMRDALAINFDIKIRSGLV